MEIRFSKKFAKQYDKSPKKIRDIFVERLELFKKEPSQQLLNNHSLKGNLLGYRSINITGDWRALYKELPDDVIIFEMLGTHSQLYK